MENELIQFSLNNNNLNILRTKQLYQQKIQNKNFEEVNYILSKFENLNNTNNGKEKDEIINIINNIKNKEYNLCGNLLEMRQALNKLDSNLFETELKIKTNSKLNNFYILSVFFKKINKFYAESLNKLPHNLFMYFLNVKPIFIKNLNNNKYILKFLITKNSKIIYGEKKLNDKECPLKFNPEITKLYEHNKNEQIKQKNLELNRISIYNNNNNNISKNIIINNINNNLITTTNNNLKTLKNKNKNYKNVFFDIIKNNEKIQRIINEYKENDISKLLTRKVEQISYSLKSIPNMLQKTNYPLIFSNVIGVVYKVKTEPKVTTIEMISLLDSNKIKVIHYPNSWKFEPNEKQILLIRNVPLKINQNFEIILENPLQNNVKELSILKDDEFKSLKIFRINKKIPFSSIINLLSPIIYRSIQKYLIIIKDVTKITSRYDEDYPSYSIEKFPFLRFFAKCIIDDGSYEAEMNLYDLMVLKILKLDKKKLEEIQDVSKTMVNYILYQKSGNTDITEFIDKNFIDEVFPKQFIAYCVPFSKIASKHFKENKIGKYFENLGKKNHDIKNKFMNTAFINGDLFYEKDYYRNKMVLMPKPLLKCVYLEELKG